MNDAVEPTLQKIETFIEGFFWMLPNLGIALVVLMLFCFGAWAAKRTVKGVFHRRRREDLGNLHGGFAKWSLIVFGLLVVATIVFPSVSPASILSTLGIGSIAIGFAFKDILQNWLSGFLILYRQPFRTNDQIRSGDFEGTVERIEARATLIRTYDGQLVVIPNADIYTRAVMVRTAFPKRRSEYTVGIGYGDDIDNACETILRAIEGAPGILKDPAPEALPWSLDSSTVNILVRWWTDSRRSSVVAAQARIIPAIKRALVEKGIDMPFPRRSYCSMTKPRKRTATARGSARAGLQEPIRRRRITSTRWRSSAMHPLRRGHRRRVPTSAAGTAPPPNPPAQTRSRCHVPRLLE